MSQRDILRALRGGLNSLGLGIPLQYPNVKSTPPSGAARGEVHFILNPPEVYTLGDGGLDMHSGIVQVTLIYPRGVGDSELYGVADQIRGGFVAGSRKWFGGQEVVIQNCGADIAGELDGMFVCPVSIYWYALTERN